MRFGAQGQQHTGFGQQGQPQQGNIPSQDHVWRELALVSAKFDTTSPLCHFRHYFYNIVPRNEMHLYVRPPNQDEQLGMRQYVITQIQNPWYQY
ncbi:unnamed protein product [Rhizopus stolonifer]